MIEDVEADFLLIERQIRRSALSAEVRWVKDADELSVALDEGGWDLVLSDYKVTGLDFLDTLGQIKERLPEAPVILVSGSVGEETAVELLKTGLCDFVLKDRLTRLIPAIERSLSEQAEKRRREEAEQKLAKNEQLMRAVLEGTSDAIFVKDRQGRYLFLNSAAARSAGRDTDAVIGQDDTFLFQAETAAAIMAQDRMIMEKGVTQTEEEWTTTRNGERIAFLVTKGPISDESGRVSGIFGIARDITASRQAEEALRESEARFRTYVESAPMAIIVADGLGRFHDVNPAAIQLLGYDRATLLGMGVMNLAPAEDLEKLWRDFKGMLVSGNFQGEYRLFARDGRIIWISLRGVRIAKDRFLAYFQDITERKNVERAQQFNLRLLELVHDQPEMPLLISEFVREIKAFVGCDAVGIRVLEADGSIPYQAYEGFSRSFFEAESPLSIKSDRCMCINVIKGISSDTCLPFLTPGGSFYMNGTTRFLATVSEEEKEETRNVCNMAGYESVALVPFRSAGQVTGLIHVADRRDNRVPLPLVEILERAMMQLGTAFERARARAELRESEERLRAIIDNASGIVWVKDLAGRFQVVNAYVLDILGKTSQEVVGRTVFDLYPRSLAEEYSENDRRMLDSGQPLQVEEPAVLADGPHTFLSVRFPLRNRSGRIYGLSAICTDISRLKKAEAALKEQEEKYRRLSQEYRTLLDNVPDGIVHLSPALEVRWANAAVRKMFNLEDKELLGKTCHVTFRNREKICTPCPVMQSLSSRRNEIGDITSAADGREFEIRGVPVLGDAGEVEGIIEIIRDITTRRKLEEQFRQAQKMESIGTFVGGIAHDFNNILSAILGYGELALEEMGEDAPERESVNTIIEAGKRASHLTKDLLLFSRKQVSRKRPVEVNAVIAQVEKFIRRIIGEDIQCETHLAPRPLVVFADDHQIEQVLMNFATNARDAMPNGGSFSVSTEYLELDQDFVETHGFGSAGPYALITVADTGRGMDRQTAGKIFEPFFTTKETGKGTGLGLAVVYGIIKEHQGYITVYSESGKGTVFRVYLSVIDGEGQTAEARTETEKPRGGQETILLAEDEVAVRRLMSTILERNGYKVIEAVNGEEAVRKFTENKDRVDMLLFDLVMPKMDGKQAVDAIRQIHGRVKGIFVSGYAPENIEQRELSDLQMEVLFKPVSPTELLQAIRRILDTD